MPEGNIFHGWHGKGTNVTGLASQILGKNRVAFVRHGRRAFLTFAEEFLNFKDFGPLQVTNLNRDSFQR